MAKRKKKEPVNTLEEFEKILSKKTLDDDDLYTSAYIEGIIYVDWPDTFTIVTDVAKKLNIELIGVDEGDKLYLELGEKEVEVDILPPEEDNGTSQINIILGVAEILKPEYDMRVLQGSFHNDHLTYLIAPTDWWKKWDKKKPSNMKKVFYPLVPEIWGDPRDLKPL